MKEELTIGDNKKEPWYRGQWEA